MTGAALHSIISCALAGVVTLRDFSDIEKRVNLTVLFDLYGPILTSKQREVFEMHELMDLSLGEISEKMGVSRQAAHDLLQRSVERLRALDHDLAFSAKVREYDDNFGQIRDLLGSWRSELPDVFVLKLEQILNSGG